MSPQEPTLGQVRDELKADLKHDERLRQVEVQQAVTTTSLDGLRIQIGTLREENRGMEARLVAAIEAARPKPWPAVSALVAAVALILLVAQSLYGA